MLESKGRCLGASLKSKPSLVSFFNAKKSLFFPFYQGRVTGLKSSLVLLWLVSDIGFYFKPGISMNKYGA